MNGMGVLTSKSSDLNVIYMQVITLQPFKNNQTKLLINAYQNNVIEDVILKEPFETFQVINLLSEN